MRARKKTGRLMLDILSTILYILLNIIFYILVIFMIMKVSSYAYDFSYQVFGKAAVTKGKPAYEVSIEIKQGDSTLALAGLLEKKKIILNKYSFYLRAKLSKSNIMPGKYKLHSSMAYEEIFEIITKKPKDELGFSK